MAKKGDQSKQRKNDETPSNVTDFVKMTVKCFHIENAVLSRNKNFKGFNHENKRLSRYLITEFEIVLFIQNQLFKILNFNRR